MKIRDMSKKCSKQILFFIKKWVVKNRHDQRTLIGINK